MNYKSGYYTLGGGFDYISGPYTVRIPANVKSISFSILITNDNIKEDNETFRLVIDADSLPDDVIIGTPSQATVTIVDTTKCKVLSFVIVHSSELPLKGLYF